MRKDKDTDFPDIDSLESEFEVIYLMREIVDLDQVSDFLLFCGLSNEDIIEKATSYLEAVL